MIPTSQDITFIGIGAAKSGTTWLARMLMQHPDIYIPPQKELHYFNDRIAEDPDVHNPNRKLPVAWYLRQFKHALPSQIVGELSPTYIWNENAARYIHDFAPQVKILAILRDPAERAFSEYNYLRKQGYVTAPSLSEHLASRPDLLQPGLYYRGLKRYYERFPAEQIGVFFFEDLVRDNRDFLERVESFLGVEPFVPDDIDKKVNEGDESRLPVLNRGLASARLFLRRRNWYSAIRALRAMGASRVERSIRRANAKPFDEKPRIPLEDKQRLRDYYRPDIERLEKLVGRDLSAWM